MQPPVSKRASPTPDATLAEVVANMAGVTGSVTLHIKDGEVQKVEYRTFVVVRSRPAQRLKGAAQNTGHRNAPAPGDQPTTARSFGAFRFPGPAAAQPIAA